MLEHATTTDMLMVVIEMFHRHLDVWASMNAIGTIITALYSAHQLWRSRGVQSRALLALLVKLDNGHHLDDVSREHVAADISAFAHVSISLDYWWPLILMFSPGFTTRH